MKKYLLWLAMLAALSTGDAPVYAQTDHNVVYQASGQDYEGYYVPANEGAPLVLLIHDWDGLTDYEKKRAHMLAEQGYSVFAADLFGKGVRPEEVEERRKLTGALYEDRAKMRDLLNGALETAKKEGANTENAAATGYCFGGAAVLELARSGADLKGFAPFHGGLETPEGQDYSKTKGSVIVFHGTADSSVSMEEFAALAKELEEAQVDHEMISYAKAVHAFTVFDRPERYNENADKKSWKRFLEFLDEKLQE